LLPQRLVGARIRARVRVAARVRVRARVRVGVRVRVRVRVRDRVRVRVWRGACVCTMHVQLGSICAAASALAVGKILPSCLVLGLGLGLG